MYVINIYAVYFAAKIKAKEVLGNKLWDVMTALLSKS
jgi:hypothetical protein